MANLFNLNLRDVIKGLVMTVLAAVLASIYQAVTNNASVDWNQVLQIAFSTGLGYLIKNFFTDENGKLMGKL